jgi:hypothetical protein
MEGTKPAEDTDNKDQRRAESIIAFVYMHRITLVDISGAENWFKPAAAPRWVNRRRNGSRESETKA